MSRSLHFIFFFFLSFNSNADATIAKIYDLFNIVQVDSDKATKKMNKIIPRRFIYTEIVQCISFV